jgi:hypothetical protein
MTRFVVFALALGVLGSVAVGNASASGPWTAPLLKSPGYAGGAAPQFQERFAHPATHISRAKALAQSAAGTTVTMWHRNVIDGGTTYTYTMVGKNPFVTGTSNTATTQIYVVPVKLVFTSFSNYTADPSAADACDSGAKTDLYRLQNSPLFKTTSWYFGGTSTGAASQYIDAFQRAEFWKFANPSGANPSYNDNLGVPHVTPTIQVPVTGGDVVAGTCGNIGLMDFATWDNYLQTQLFPLLDAQSFAPPGNSLVIFLLTNTVLYQGTTSNCCILGYHSAFTNPNAGGATQTYISAEYDTNRSFTAVEDVSAMSHEIGEWMNDPLGNNPTPSWGNIGQVSGCQANLEVGDPLSGSNMVAYMSGTNFTYHVQELAFFSWFYHQKPSLGINGWYSDNDGLETPAAAC